MDITPKLLWHPVMNGDKACGDVLVTAELILRDKVHCCVLTHILFSVFNNNSRYSLTEHSMFVSQDGSNLPILPSQRAPHLYMVPQGIRPVVQLTAIEVCCSLMCYLIKSDACDYRPGIFHIENGILLHIFLLSS
jgi:hypothetical protein